MISEEMTARTFPPADAHLSRLVQTGADRCFPRQRELQPCISTPEAGSCSKLTHSGRVLPEDALFPFFCTLFLFGKAGCCPEREGSALAS